MHHWRMMMIFRYSETSEITMLCSKQTQRNFWSVPPAVKNTLFCAYSMPMYACQLWSKYTQTSMKRLRAAYNNAYRVMHYIPRNVIVRPHLVKSIVSGPLMPCWETTCIDFLYDAHLHPSFLFDCFQCLILFTNLHFSSIIQRSCVVDTECSSCSWVVSVFASHQYCLCVVKICGNCVHTKQKKVRSARKVFCSSQSWTHTNTGCVMPYRMVIHFLCSCEWRYSCGEKWG